MKKNKLHDFFKFTAVFLLFFVVMTPFFVAIAAQVLPASGEGANPATTIINPIKASTLSELIYNIVDVVVYLGGIVSVIFLIYAGYLFVAARGKSEELIKAKMSFLYTVIGVGVLIGAKVIAEIIENTMKSLK